MNQITNDQIKKTIEALLPYGAGPLTSQRLRTALETIAALAWREAESQVLLNLLTVEDIAELFGVSPRRVQALAKTRHARFGIGYQVPGTRTWLFRPEEIELLRPGKTGRPAK